MSVDGVNVVSGATAAWDQGGYVFYPGEQYQVTGWRKSDTEIAAFTFTESPNSYAERTGRPANVGVIGVALFRERPPLPVAAQLTPPTDARDRYDAEPSSLPPTEIARIGPPAPAAAIPPSAAATRQQNALPAAVAQAPAASTNAMQPPAAPIAALPRAESLAAPPAPTAAPEPKLGTGHGNREYSFVANTQFQRMQSTPNEILRIHYDSRANLIAMGIIPRGRPPATYGNPFPGSEPSYVPDPPG